MTTCFDDDGSGGMQEIVSNNLWGDTSNQFHPEHEGNYVDMEKERERLMESNLNP